MTLNEFIKKWTGKKLEVTGSPGALNQCVDLVNGYIRDVLGLPVIKWTNAIFFPEVVGDEYEWIQNTPTGIPLKGDIMIFDIGKYGHISVFIDGNVNSFNSFDQNWPVGTGCHIQKHNYNNVVGWLRPKGGNMDALSECLKQHKKLMSIIKEYEEFVIKLEGVLLDA